MSAEDLDKLKISALLHDVGKIGVDDRVLKKPGSLTPEEFEIMKTHTTKGANIMRPVSQLKDMLPGIELHHEHLDGRGYPYGLSGPQIPLMARIIAVADTLGCDDHEPAVPVGDGSGVRAGPHQGADRIEVRSVGGQCAGIRGESGKATAFRR